MVTLKNKHVGRIDRSQAQQISPVVDIENKQLSSQALVLVPLCRIVDCTNDYTHRLEIVGKDNRQLLSQIAGLTSSHIGMNCCITEANNLSSVVALPSNPDNGVSLVMAEASTELRC